MKVSPHAGRLAEASMLVNVRDERPRGNGIVSSATTRYCLLSDSRPNPTVNLRGIRAQRITEGRVARVRDEHAACREAWLGLVWRRGSRREWAGGSLPWIYFSGRCMGPSAGS